ncbi:MAG TPA: hypothetical protein VJ576_06575 [Rhodocyclaceae bacterium]|nr:hypothetical protein [Rhodocyclaceae bacterium]
MKKFNQLVNPFPAASSPPPPRKTAPALRRGAHYSHQKPAVKQYLIDETGMRQEPSLDTMIK